jgi:hypothetical protein
MESMLPFLAMILPALVLFCGLAIDVGALENAQTLDQMAADSAAGSAALEFQSGSGAWATVGRQTAALYGLNDGSNGVTVNVQQQPAGGAYAGRNDAIQVNVLQPSPTYFMHFLTATSNVKATAVALLPPCIVLRAAQAMTVSASTFQTACPVYANGAIQTSGSNSWSSAGLLLTANGSIDTSLAASIASPARMIGDPLAAMAQPVASGCMMTTFSQNGGSVTLQPGTYCNGMTLKNATVTLSPGMYVFTGGAHWTGVTLSGQGVTLFFTSGSTGYGQFVIEGNSSVSLSAPVDASASALPGVVVFGDRAWQAQSTADFQISGSQVQTNGIWYTTGTGLALSNASLTGPSYLGLDVDSLTLSSSTLQGGGDMSSVTTGNPFQTLGGLAE